MVEALSKEGISQEPESCGVRQDFHCAFPGTGQYTPHRLRWGRLVIPSMTPAGQEGGTLSFSGAGSQKWVLFRRFLEHLDVSAFLPTDITAESLVRSVPSLSTPAKPSRSCCVWTITECSIGAFQHFVLNFRVFRPYEAESDELLRILQATPVPSMAEVCHRLGLKRLTASRKVPE